ncbi:MAG: hypothetical protein A2202_01590 [Bdellovibrionales bacterium RIFOXYA1_FULL_36_14]|nr:MAG: hypothetical protein A2202_01590 [Bdellovibrionales bacterium RIFOXYA1_FULL_36_14]
MNANILIADDSLTIQKVVSIMLANEPYTLTQCSAEGDLFTKYLKNDYDLILLDYNFSSKLSGIELVKKILEVKPDSILMVMLGTFDSVDEKELKEVGARDIIVKPFESSLFLKKCSLLLNREVAQDDLNIYFKDEADSVGEEWKVSGPKPQELDIPDLIDENTNSKNSTNLHVEVESWGISIPDVIGKPAGSGTTPEIPDIIEEKETGLLPTGANLEYPENKSLAEKYASSKMVRIDSLTVDLADDNDEVNDSTEEIALAKLSSDGWENDVTNDQEDDEFWVENDADERDKKPSEDSMFKVVEDEAQEDQIFIQQEEDEGTDEITVVNLADEVENTVKKDAPFKDETSEVNEEFFKNKIKEIITLHYEEDIINRLKEHMGPLLEKYVHQYCKETIEKVTWEIIPDLAENLIKKELKKITESISENN